MGERPISLKDEPRYLTGDEDLSEDEHHEYADFDDPGDIKYAFSVTLRHFSRARSSWSLNRCHFKLKYGGALNMINWSGRPTLENQSRWRTTINISSPFS